MEIESSRLPGLNRDILGNIMDRLDGPTLAAASCVCRDLRDTARDRELWKRACHSLWPSTAIPGSTLLISDHNKFYAESYPLVFYEEHGAPKIETDKASLCGPEDLASMVDVYFKNKCIFSTVSVGVPEAMTTNSPYSKKWFSSCPFKWDVSSSFYTSAPTAKCDNQNRLLQEGLTLSWVLIDKKKGKTVNLSSWNPVSTERTWSSNGDYRVQFGCIVPVEDNGLSKCTITTRCSLAEGGEALEVKEITLHIEDLTGAHVNGRRGLMVLNQALLCCSRTIHHFKVKRGFCSYQRHKKQMMRKKEHMEMAAIGFFVLVEVVAFVLLLYVFTQRF